MKWTKEAIEEGCKVMHSTWWENPDVANDKLKNSWRKSFYEGLVAASKTQGLQVEEDVIEDVKLSASKTVSKKARGGK